MHVRKGDQVVVIAGKEKGKRGRVLRLVTDKGRVVIERVNMVKRHTKPTQRNPRGGIWRRKARSRCRTSRSGAASASPRGARSTTTKKVRRSAASA